MQPKITSAQETAWQAYAVRVKQDTASRMAASNEPPPMPATASARLAQRTEEMQQRAVARAARTKAFNALYALMTPGQKAIADQTVELGPRGKRPGQRAG